MTAKKRTVALGLSLICMALIVGLFFLLRNLGTESPAFFPATESPVAVWEKPILNRPISVHDAGYIGADACRECHQDNFASWHDSYHRTMTQVATSAAAAPSFKDVVLDFANSSVGKVTLRQEGEKLWADFEEHDSLGRSKIVRQPIVMMTGSHHAQGYWYPSGEGRDLKRFPFMYRIDQQRWITDRANFLMKPAEHALSHTTGVWNHLCDRCHTTRPQPRLEEDGHYDTHVAEFGIACESCHGPGAAHAESVAKGDATIGMVNPLTLSPRRSAEICGQCHAEMAFRTKSDYFNWVHNGDYYQPGESLEDHLKIKDVDAHAFWQDGMVRISGREFNGLLKSPCFAHNDPSRQMTCLSCHVMHQPVDDPRSRKEWANDQLKLVMDSNRPGLHNNEACIQCHTEYTDEEKLTAHTHHAPTSTGSICYNCHMPNSTWGLMKAMRSHTISSPNVKESLPPIGRPNACNLCHLDKTLLWTAEKLHQQYDQPIPPLDEEQRNTATGLLWGLKGDAAQRALIAWNLGWPPAKEAAGTSWMIPLLAQLLVDPYDAVRSRSFLTLRAILGSDAPDYDFLAPESDREAVRAEVLHNWDTQADSRKSRGMPELFLKPDGQLDQEKFDRLLRWRDDREVFLSE